MSPWLREACRAAWHRRDKNRKGYGVRSVGNPWTCVIRMSVDKVIREIYDEFGKIDILVNSAGTPE